MKTHPRPGQAAFTLVELMAVVTIIVLLAAVVVGGMGFVGERQNKEKARVQIALLSKALEEYKADLGTYPPTPDKAGSFDGTAGTDTSDILFNALFWDSDNDQAGAGQDDDQKIYLPELDPASSKQGWTTGTAAATLPILDPWGNEYCYRSATTADGTANSGTQNPDFDLWSMGKDGKTNADPKHKDSRDDIKNF